METKYLTLLDEETLEFVRQTDAFYPPDAINAPIERQRDYYNALCNEFHKGYPESISASDRWIKTRDNTVRVRDYVNASKEPNAHIVFFHGGGFVVGGLESHDSICAEFCDRTGFRVTAVDYRLSPEFTHPAAFDDCLNVYRRVANETNLPTILVGDSAGGNLAAAVSHKVRSDKKTPIGQVLIYPALGGDQSQGSYQDHSHAPALTLADIEYYHHIRAGGSDVSHDVTASPLSDEDFSNLPPTVIFTAECDPLADDGRDYRDQILPAGGKAVWVNEKGLVHGYLRARVTVKRAADSVTRMVEALQMLGEGKWEF